MKYVSPKERTARIGKILPKEFGREAKQALSVSALGALAIDSWSQANFHLFKRKKQFMDYDSFFIYSLSMHLQLPYK